MPTRKFFNGGPCDTVGQEVADQKSMLGVNQHLSSLTPPDPRLPASVMVGAKGFLDRLMLTVGKLRFKSYPAICTLGFIRPGSLALHRCADELYSKDEMRLRPQEGFRRYGRFSHPW